MNSRNENKVIFKSLVIGAEQSGKSSLLKKFQNQPIDQQYAPTIGVDIIPDSVDINDQKVRLQLWDVAGQKRFQPVTTGILYKDLQIVFVTLDLTNQKMLATTEEQLYEVRRASKEQNPIIILVGTKADLPAQITQEEIECFKQKHRIDVYIPTSAKNGTNVKELFVLAATLAFNKLKKIVHNRKVESQIAPNPLFVKKTKIYQSQSQLLSRIEQLSAITCGININKKVNFNSWSRNFFKARMEKSLREYLEEMVSIDIKKATKIVTALENDDVNSVKCELGKHRNLIHFGQTTGMEIFSKALHK